LKLTLEYTIRKVQENKELVWDTLGSGLCWLCEVIRQKHKYHKKKRKAVLDASKELDLGVNTEKTKSVFMHSHQTAGHHYLIVASKSFENIAELKYLGLKLRNRN
jgi:hypothetical protein